MSNYNTAAGCLFGMAFGDSLGADTEFLNISEILHRFPPDGPRALRGNPAEVTDDTQMALAVGEALTRAPRPLTPNVLYSELRATFVYWWASPENNRAPGRTCLTACERLAHNELWLQATVRSSKGCGANMRVQPVGLLALGQTPVDQQIRSAIAQFQAAITHGHPTALAASDLTAFAVYDLALGGEPSGLLGRLKDYALAQRSLYHEEWLGTLWQRPGVSSPIEFIERGWDECLAVLDRLERALAEALNTSEPGNDPCIATGEGWVAEEALATGLYCFLLTPDEPLEVVHRAAVTSGDSDSIAALAGSFVGAHLGENAWPREWSERIEYKEGLAKLAESLCS